MPRTQFESAVNEWILVLGILLCVLLTIFAYKTTKPALLNWQRRILAALRAIILATMLLLIADSIFHYFVSENHTQRVRIFTDKSASLNAHSARQDSTISALQSIFPSAELVPFNDGDENSFTDIAAPLKEFSRLSRSSDIGILLSDGNHNSARTSPQSSYPFQLISVPIGKYPPKNTAEIDLSAIPQVATQRVQLATLPVRIKSADLHPKTAFKLFVNDSLIFTETLHADVDIQRITPPFLPREADSVFTIVAQIKNNDFETQARRLVRLKEKKQELLHIAFRPSLNAKFAALALEDKQFHKRSIFKAALPKLAELRPDLAIVSDLGLFSAYDQNVITTFLQTTNTPFILTGNLPSQIEKLGINTLNLRTQKKAVLRLPQRPHPFFAPLVSSIRDEDFSEFPALESALLQVTTARGTRVSPLFPSFAYLVERGSMPRGLIITSQSLWRLHLTASNSLGLSTFFAQFVGKSAQLITTKPRDLLKITTSPRSPRASEPFVARIAYTDNSGIALPFDRLVLSLHNSDAPLHEHEFAFSETGKYAQEFTLPSHNEHTLLARVFVDGKQTVQKRVRLRAERANREAIDRYVNTDFFNSIGSQIVQPSNLSQLSKLRQGAASSVLKKQTFLPIEVEWLLYLLLALLSIEWFARKQFKLL